MTPLHTPLAAKLDMSPESFSAVSHQWR